MNRPVDLKKLILPLFYLIYTGVLLFIAKEMVLWEDEMYSLNTSSGSLARAYTQSYLFEGQPPVYFLLLSVWRQISDSILFARALSLLFTLGAGYYFYRLTKQMLSEKYGIIFTILFLLNPFIIWHATEVRLYAMILFLSTASLYYYFRYFIDASGQKKELILYLVFALIGVFTQYLFTFLLIGQALVLIVFKGWRPFIRIVLYLMPVALLFGLNVFAFHDHMATHQTDAMSWSLDNILKFFRTIQNYLFSLDKALLGKFMNRIILAIYFVWLVNVLIRYKKFRLYKKLNRNAFYSIILISVIVFIFFVLSFVFQSLNYYDRYMMLLFPGVFLVFMISLSFPQNIIRTIIFILLTAFYIYGNFRANRGFVKTFDYEYLAAFLEDNISSDEPVLVYRNVHVLPLKQYFTGKNELTPIPVPIKYDISYLSSGIIKDSTTLNYLFDIQLQHSNHFTLVSDEKEESYGYDMHQDLITDYLKEHFTIQEDTIFYGRSEVNYLRIRKFTR